MLIIKKGDLVYFKENHISKYSTGDYHFSTDIPYIVITEPRSGTCTIEAPDGTNHFIYSSGRNSGPYNKLITSRQKNLERLGI